MLSKLIRHEFKSTWKMIAILNLFIAVITGLGVLTIVSKIWNSESEHVVTFVVLSAVFYYISIIVVSLAASIYIAVRYYKNLYTDEGYLMHTLPVTKHDLLISKTLTGSVYMLITSVMIMLSFIFMGLSIFYNLAPTEQNEIITSLYYEAWPEVKQFFGATIGVNIVLFTFYYLLSCISSVLMSFCAISVGQLFTKHKVMGAIFCYIGLYVVLQLVASFITVPFTGVSLLDQNLVPALFVGMMAIEIIATAVLCLIFYVVSHYVMNKRLNLD